MKNLFNFNFNNSNPDKVSEIRKLFAEYLKGCEKEFPELFRENVVSNEQNNTLNNQEINFKPQPEIVPNNEIVIENQVIANTEPEPSFFNSPELFIDSLEKSAREEFPDFDSNPYMKALFDLFRKDNFKSFFAIFEEEPEEKLKIFNFDLFDLKFLIPEIFLSGWSIFILIISLYLKLQKTYFYPKVLNFTITNSIIGLFIVLILYFTQLISLSSFKTGVIFSHEYFFITEIAIFVKFFLTLILIILLFLSYDFFEKKKINIFEIPFFMCLSLLGMNLALSSLNLIIIFLAFEIQSFCFYVLAAISTKNKLSTEAGLKYFLLGSISSSFLAFGISLLYGMTAHVDLKSINLFLNLKIMFKDYDFISHTLISNTNLHLFLICLVATLFILVSLLFKLGLTPFHNWIIEVYDGALTIITAFFALTQKFVIATIFYTLSSHLFIHFKTYLDPVLYLIIILSFWFGITGALNQKKVKRFIACSSIVNSSYILIGLTLDTLSARIATYLYLFVYTIVLLVFFTILLSLITEDYELEELKDLQYLKHSNILVSFALSLCLFSLAGIPPLAGFFIKYYLFISMVNENMYFLLVLVVIFTVIVAAYYINLIVYLFFTNTENRIINYTVKPMPLIHSLIISFGTLFNLQFLLMPQPFIIWFTTLIEHSYLF